MVDAHHHPAGVVVVSDVRALSSDFNGQGEVRGGGKGKRRRDINVSGAFTDREPTASH